MDKAPADQFYWADWLRDHQLQQASPLVRGIWANILGHAWFSNEQGKVTGNPASLARLGNCTIEEFDMFLEEAELYQFCDVSRSVTNGHTNVTVTCRRQYRKWLKKEKERKDAAERKRKQRVREKSQDVSRSSHASRARSASSSASSSSSSKRDKEIIYTPDFENWWTGYPVKQGKANARLFYDRWRNKGVTAEELIRGRDRYKKAKAKTDNSTFSNGSTFLNPDPPSGCTSSTIEDYLDKNFQEDVPACTNCKHGGGFCIHLMATPSSNQRKCDKYERV